MTSQQKHCIRSHTAHIHTHALTTCHPLHSATHVHIYWSLTHTISSPYLRSDKHTQEHTIYVRTQTRKHSPGRVINTGQPQLCHTGCSIHKRPHSIMHETRAHIAALFSCILNSDNLTGKAHTVNLTYPALDYPKMSFIRPSVANLPSLRCVQLIHILRFIQHLVYLTHLTKIRHRWINEGPLYIVPKGTNVHT